MTLTHSSTRIVAVTIGVAVALTLVVGAFATAAPARAASLTQSQISSIVSLLQSFGADPATIANVQASLNGQSTVGTGTTGTTGGACPALSRSLSSGSTGADVMALQKFLNSNAATQVSVTGAGSPGSESTYFGPATMAAVEKFQTLNNVSAIGIVGPATRAAIAAVCGKGTTTGGTTTGGTTTTGTAAGTAVVSAAAQPANTVAPAGAARVPYTAFTVTANGADVTVNSVTVMRQGPSLDTDFAGVELIDASTGVQIGTSRILDANHSATIGSAITIPAGTSKTFWVAGNIATGQVNSGNIASFAVTAVNTASTVSGSLPITGASNTMNAGLTIGSATIQSSSFDPVTSSSQPVGTTGYRFTGFRIQAGSVEDLTFKSVTWYNAGSASGLANVMTVVNGTSYPTTLDSTGRYYTSVFPSGIVIPKGNSTDVYVQADLGSNSTSNTTAQFDVYRNTDIYLVGNTYGFGITPTSASGGSIASFGAVTNPNGTSATCTNSTATCFTGISTANPYLQGAQVTVTGGTFSTIQNATSVASQNVAVNVNNQPLGGFMTNLTGEAITAQSVKIHFTTSTAIAPLQNVSLVSSNGSTIAGPYTATCDTGSTNGICSGSSLDNQTVTFQGSINFPVGAYTYTIQGEVPSGTASGVTIQASTAPATDWTSVSGNTTGNNIAISVTNFTMNQMTVKAAALNVANSSTPTSQTVVAGSQMVTFANIQLDASQSGENVRLTSLPLELTLSTYATTTDLSNCQLFNGTTALNTGSRVVNSTNISSTATENTTINPVNFNFDNSLTVPKGTVLTLALQCNLVSSAGANQSYIWSASHTAVNYSVSGANSGAGVTGSALTIPGANGGPTMTVSTGATLAAYTDSSSPSYSVTANGTTGVSLGVIRMHATNGAVTLQDLGLTLNTNLASTSDLSAVYVYAGNNVQTTAGVAMSSGTLLGTANFTGSSGTATTTFTAAGGSVLLPANQDATFVIKGDIAGVGGNTNVAVGAGHVIKINYLNSQGTSVGSTVYGSTLQGGGVQGVLVYKSFPIFTQSTTAAMSNGTIPNLVTLNVAANSSGPITLYQLNFSIATTSALYTVPTFTGPNGSVGTVSLNTAGTLLTVTFNSSSNQSDAVISTSKSYNLGGNIVLQGNSGSTGSISIALKGDATAGLPNFSAGGLSATTTSPLSTSNIMWSPMSTTTVVGTTGLNDWTNSYGLGGCYQAAGLGADCFATTVAK
jgi:hypothetical protein